MSSIYFTADLHFNHDFVAGTRRRYLGEGYYASDVEHDEDLIERWNDRVTKRDTVWVLGDVGMGSLTNVLELVGRLNGTKHLVYGNHDPGHPMHRGAHNKLRRYLEVFESAQLAAQIRIDGKLAMLSHFPYQGDHGDVDRYPEWRLRDEGLPLLHGHVHDAYTFSALGLNVGQDPYPELLDYDQARGWVANR